MHSLSLSEQHNNDKHFQLKILKQIQTKYNDDIKQRHNRLSKPLKFNISVHSLFKALNINGKIKSTKKVLMSASILKSQRKHKNRFYQSNYNEYNENYSFINTKLHFVPFTNGEHIFSNSSSCNIQHTILTLSKKDCDLINILKCNIIPKIQNEFFKKKNQQQQHTLQLVHNKFHTIKNIHYTFCKIRYITLCKSKEMKIEAHFTNPNDVFDNSIFSGKVFEKTFKPVHHCFIPHTKHDDVNKSMIKENDIKDLLHLNSTVNVNNNNNNNIKRLSFIESKYNISLEQSPLHKTKELLLNSTCIDTFTTPTCNNNNTLIMLCTNANNVSSNEKKFHFHKLPLMYRSEYIQHTRKKELLTFINNYNTHSDTHFLNLMQVNSTSNILYLQPSSNELSSYLRNLTFPSSVNYSTLFNNQTQLTDLSIKPLPQLNISSTSTLKTKRSYTTYIQSQHGKQTSTSQSDPIILNKLTIGSVYTYKKSNFIYCDNIHEDIDIIFDIDVCGLFFSSSDLADEYEVNAFEEMFQIINASYTYYSTFYVIILDDQRNKMTLEYTIDNVINRVHSFLNAKFSVLLKQQILVYKIKTVRNIAEMHICLANILHEIKGNLNVFSLYNVCNYHDIVNMLYSKVNKDNYMLDMSNVNEWKEGKYAQLNTFEKILCALIHKEQDKESVFKQLKEMIVQVRIYIYNNCI